MFEFLARIGIASATAFWVPVLVWTGLAGAVALSLTLARGLHPMMGYRLRQSLLLALPASVLAAPWIPAPWLPSRGLLRPDLPTTLEPAMALPAIGGIPLGPDPATGVDIALALLGAASVGVLLLAVVRLAMLAADLQRLGKLRVTAPRVGDPAPNRLLRAIAGQFGVRRAVELLEGPPDSVPMTFGARKPVVVVPRSLLDSPESLKIVLAHELIHIRRADYVWALLDCLTAALFAFHPLIRLLRRRNRALPRDLLRCRGRGRGHRAAQGIRRAAGPHSNPGAIPDARGGGKHVGADRHTERKVGDHEELRRHSTHFAATPRRRSRCRVPLRGGCDRRRLRDQGWARCACTG